MSVMLPQYPTYFDTDTPQKQIEVVRSYLGELKTALESNMSAVKMSDLDQDVQDLFTELQNGISLSDEELAKTERDISTLFALLNQEISNIQTLVNQLETQWFCSFLEAGKLGVFVRGGTMDGTIYAQGSITTEGQLLADGSVITDGNLVTSGQLQVDGASFLEGELKVGTTQTSANTFLHGQLQVDGNAFIDGQLTVGDSQSPSNSFLHGQVVIDGQTKVNDYLRVEGGSVNVTPVMSGGSLLGGNVNTYGGNINSYTGTYSGNTYGGKFYAAVGYQTPDELVGDKYYHHMTMQYNGETVHFLGYKDSDFPPQS